MVSANDLVYSKLAAQKMHHRGPDDDGYWNNNHFALSFKRLSILDLSSLGNQPMISQCENYVLVYNGELYNHIDIRKTLINKGYHFRSTSDSEVVIYALIEWGTNALPMFNGMFALGFLNIREESLLIARDHVGMKPLYFCNLNGNFVFGSQLDHIMHYFNPKYLNINIDALYMYMAIGYYFAPNSVFNEIKQLEPGKWLKIDIKGKEKTGVYFDLTEFYLENQNNRYNQIEFEEKLEKAVASHLMSDVPVGTFLSGGLDSSIITGVVDQKRGKPFDAYTVGDFDKYFDESKRASLIAAKLKQSKHHIIFPNNIPDYIEQFSDAYQEPFGDYSAIPSLMVAAEAKKKVKVILSGDGSDELLFGYSRMQPMLRAIPFYDFSYNFRKIIDYMPLTNIPGLLFNNKHELILASQSLIPSKELLDLGVKTNNIAAQFSIHNNANLPNDIFIKLNNVKRYLQSQMMKLDRSSMYHSLEARVPFLDKELLKLTIAYRAHEITENNYSVRKTLLNKKFQKLYPNIPLEKGIKKGFVIDIKSQFDTNLRSYLFDNLSSDTVFSSYIDFQYGIDQIKNNKSKYSFYPWVLLSLQLWALKYNSWNKSLSN